MMDNANTLKEHAIICEGDLRIQYEKNKGDLILTDKPLIVNGLWR